MRIQLYLAAVLAPLSLAGCMSDEDPPSDTPSMTFFITSKGGPLGGDFRRWGMNDTDGLAGADEHCRSLAAAADPSHGTKAWRAYLSTSTVNAKDRIGKGPWYNQKLVKIADSVADLLDPTLPANGGKNKIDGTTGLDEQGRGVGVIPHDILTGSNADGTNSGANCQDWTTESQLATATVGRYDRTASWSTARESGGCSVQGLINTGGRGSIYCFVAN